jgi:hypothetical protein
MLLDTRYEAEDRLDIETPAIVAPLLPSRLDERTLGVVALSWKDDLRSVLPPTRLGRLAAQLFGLRPTTPLADARLEALRRYCVLTRYRHAHRSEAWNALRDTGFTSADRILIDALLVG